LTNLLAGGGQAETSAQGVADPDQCGRMEDTSTREDIIARVEGISIQSR